MIELISTERCVDCNLCVKVCPTNVFEAQSEGPPSIARPDACQTCFMCELYCPADALYVSPLADAHDSVDEAVLAARGQLGSYSRQLGWRAAKPGGTALDPTFRFRVLMSGAG
jgi:NAD-dependent dihydropyrimidine dehydrogenase PreA subunit